MSAYGQGVVVIGFCAVAVSTADGDQDQDVCTYVEASNAGYTKRNRAAEDPKEAVKEPEGREPVIRYEHALTKQHPHVSGSGPFIEEVTKALVKMMNLVPGKHEGRFYLPRLRVIGREREPRNCWRADRSNGFKRGDSWPVCNWCQRHGGEQLERVMCCRHTCEVWPVEHQGDVPDFMCQVEIAAECL